MAIVNQKIGELDKSLQDYTQLVFDSRVSSVQEEVAAAPPNPLSPRSSLASAKHRRKGQFTFQNELLVLSSIVLLANKRVMVTFC